MNISVDRNSGQITLSNQTPSAISLDSYEIRSAGNSLIASAWQSFATRPTPFSGFPQGNGTGNGWEKAPNAGAGALAEWYLNDELAPSSLGPGASVNLGNAYNSTVDAQDLSFSYRLDTGAIVPRRVKTTSFEAGNEFASDTAE